MSVEIITSQNQVQDIFDNGRIRGRKPIAFPNEISTINSFSTLFYWAHAWSEHGGLIGEHPHRGFEICTFVIQGSIEHYDNKTRKWTLLEAGATQVIRSGCGIKHAEKINPGSRIFQIWLDPNLKYSLASEPSYHDYPEKLFPVASSNGVQIKTFVGQGSPVRLQTSTRIRLLTFEPGKYIIPMTPGFRSGVFILKGTLSLNQYAGRKNDFAVLVDETKLLIDSDSKSKLFVVEVPHPAPYETFASTQQ